MVTIWHVFRYKAQRNNVLGVILTIPLGRCSYNEYGFITEMHTG